MEIHNSSSCDQSSLIKEVIKGLELAKQLQAQMGPQLSVISQKMLLQRIVSSSEKALSILGRSGTSQLPHQLLSTQLPAMPNSPVSTMGSPKNDDLHDELSKSYQDGKQTPKKRKAASTWTKQVKVNLGANPEGAPADGYSWRKYGQKDILGTKNPRSYYRCTYRNLHDCWATKQVQRSDEDPTVLHITYRGKHTCPMDRRSKSAPTSPAKQETKPDELLNMEYQQDAAVNLSFQNAPITDTQFTDCFPSSGTGFGYLSDESLCFLPSTISNPDNFYGSFSPSLISPSTSGSNYFSTSTCMNDTLASLHHEEHNLEVDISEMLSVPFSASDSPIFEQDFPLDALCFNSDLPVNNL